MASAFPEPPPGHRLVRRAFRRRRYPVWSVTTVLLTLAFVAAVAGSVTFAVAKQPWVVEFEITLAIVATFLFFFLAAGLYRGVRLKRHHFDAGGVSCAGRGWYGDLSGWNGIDTSGLADGADEPLGWVVGIVLGFLLSIAVALLVLLLVYIVVPLAWAVTVTLGLAAWWVAYLALRRVFVLSRRCRGNLVPSLGWAAWYTLLYTGWVFGLLLLVRHLIRA